jgi:phosphoglycolate phosphatase-like HAD superfamily hydrolase
VFQDKIGAREAVEVVVNASDVEAAKPEPDVLAVSLDKAGLARERCIALGDSVWDAQAAGRAALRCVALETGGFSRPKLEADGVIAVYRDPADLLDHLDDSPLATLPS